MWHCRSWLTLVAVALLLATESVHSKPAENKVHEDAKSALHEMESEEVQAKGECVQKEVGPRGSPCPSGYVQWGDPVKPRYVSGLDINGVKRGQNLESCKDWCFTQYAGTVSIDLFDNGDCYCNFKDAAFVNAGRAQWVPLTCCQPSKVPECKAELTTAGDNGPCFSNKARFVDFTPGFYVPTGADIKSAPRQTIDSCRQMCWNTPGCKSADLYFNGDCYLNAVKGPKVPNYLWSTIDFECCNPPPECVYKTPESGGSPCSRGYVQWEDPLESTYVPGNDFTMVRGMNVDSCRNLCWKWPACASADLFDNGDCYVNRPTGREAPGSRVRLLKFKCCEKTPIVVPTIPPPLPTKPPCKPETKVDVSFLLDSSDSIGKDNYYNYLIQTVVGVTEYLMPGDGDKPSNTRVSCTLFDWEAYPQWDLNTLKTRNEVIARERQLPYNAGATATGEGIRSIRLRQQPLVRSNINHIVILITDGEKTYGAADPVTEATELKNAGAKLFVIGVGREAAKWGHVLDQLASPGPNFRADVKTYEDLKDNMLRLATIACQEAVSKK